MEITRGRVPTAKRLCIYGPEGIGKSTLAAQLPNAVFIDVESGTNELTVGRLPHPKRWEGIINEIKWAAAHPEELDTLVIDTVDAAEALAIKYVCVQKGLKDIEAPGYGKGYVYLADEFGRFLRLLDSVIESGTNVCLVAHAMMRKFEEPDQMGSYDRWELKLQKKVAPLIKEWVDVLLFCNYKTDIITDSKTNTRKARGGKRVVYTTHNPCWDAKNRFDLPDMVNMEYAAIEKIFENVPAKKPVEAPPENPVKEWAETPNKAAEVLDESDDPKPFAPPSRLPEKLAKRLKEDDIPEDALRRVMVQKGYLGHTDDDFDDGTVDWLTDDATWPVVAKAVREAIASDDDLPF